MPTHWEHKVQVYKLRWKGFDYEQIEQDLNALGRQGWQAVTTISPSYGQGQATEIAVLMRRPSTDSCN